ncbi:MAG: HAMP domain-containing protein, partial [Betaproteobacteria bacterium]
MPHVQAPALLQRLRRLLGVRAGRAGPLASDTRATARDDASFHPIVLPGGHARFRSIALPMIGVLVLVASWAVGVSYYFHHRSSAALFVAEQRARAERGASTVEASILDDYRGVERAARMLAERSDLVAALSRADADDSVRVWAQRTRHLGGDIVAEIYDARGQLIDRVGDPGRYRLTGAAEADAVRRALAGSESLAAEEGLEGLNLRAVVPVHAGARVVGVVAAEQRIGAEYITRLASRIGLDIGLVARGRALAGSASADDPRWLDKIADRVAQGDGGAIALDGARDVALKPLALLPEPLAVAVLMPNDHAYGELSDSTNAFATVVLFTILATIAAGLYLTRYLIAPVKELTERAEELSRRFAGRPAVRRGDELDSLVGSFEAMTTALLSHSDRLARAHKSELQNSLELQHQYAQMRLLRGLAAAANEGDSVEETLERALREIGAYLDWPLGRVAL